MAFRLTPHERGFYPLFRRAAENIVVAADELAKLVAAEPAGRAELARRIKETENEGDALTHEILVMLNKTFVTPFDREDIYRLAGALDDVIDYIEEAADAFVLYRIPAPTATAVELASIIVKQAELLHDALSHLKGFRDLDKYWIEVHRLENEGDRLVRGAIAGLFNDQKDPIELMKWKEIYDLLETSIDMAEDVAIIIERITIKHA